MKINIIDKNGRFVTEKEFNPTEEYLTLLYDYETKAVYDKLENYKIRGLEAIIDSEHKYSYKLGDQNMNIIRHIHVYEDNELLQEMDWNLATFPLPISDLPTNLLVMKNCLN